MTKTATGVTREHRNRASLHFAFRDNLADLIGDFVSAFAVRRNHKSFPVRMHAATPAYFSHPTLQF